MNRSVPESHLFQTSPCIRIINAAPNHPQSHPLHLVHVRLGLTSRDVLLLARFAAQNIKTYRTYYVTLSLFPKVIF